MNLMLEANMKLAGDKNLEDRVLTLTTNVKVLEIRAFNADALVRSQDTEVARLRAALANANKETEKANVEKERIQQKAFDDVYNLWIKFLRSPN